jgi:hypothetical protein
MTLFRVVLFSLATAALFIVVGSWSMRALYKDFEEPTRVFTFYFSGLAGATAGAIAAAAQCIVEQLRAKRLDSKSGQPPTP